MKRNRSALIVVSVALITWFFYLYLRPVDYMDEFDDSKISKRYAIGQIIDYKDENSGGAVLVYCFYVDRRRFSGEYVVSGKKKLQWNYEMKEMVGNKFEVVYLAKQPRRSKLLIHSPLADSVSVVPY